MKQFEYQWREVTRCKENSHIMPALKKFGEDGWEVFQVETSYGGQGDFYSVWMRREFEIHPAETKEIAAHHTEQEGWGMTDLREQAAAQDPVNMEPPIPHALWLMAGKYWGKAVDKLEIRKRAMELAIQAAGPSSPICSAEEIAGRVEALADRLFTYMTTDDPARDPARTAAALKETE